MGERQPARRTTGRAPRTAARDAEALTPVPPRPVRHVLFRQFWRDLVFLHWEADPFDVARLLPPGCVPDLYRGRAYAGLVFFRMEDLAVGEGPPLPWIGAFNEVNVRLYSRDALGRRGVVFRSLDCDRLLPVLTARGGFGLPYRWSRITRQWHGRRLLYRTRGRRADAPGGHVWAEIGDEVIAPGPLDEFLTSRWGLHERGWGRTYYWPNVHPRWTFRRCDPLSWDMSSLLSAAGLEPLRAQPDSVLYAPGVPVRFGVPTPLPPEGRQS
ncbi:YqjF family protein [Streptomyces sp. bgisy032]|uniref:YqjF family protein n=1 Tax=Streptomyces sp. bgisy032 TaxID=3413773 RepID=UPI003D742AB7